MVATTRREIEKNGILDALGCAPSTRSDDFARNSAPDQQWSTETPYA